MLIQVEINVLGNSTWHPLLDTIVQLLEQDGCRHSFDIAQFEKLRTSKWLVDATGIRANTVHFIRSLSVRAFRGRPSDAVSVKIDANATRQGKVEGKTIRIDPFGALVLLIQPLSVIVEDETTDGGFLLWMARALGHDTIRESYNSGSLVFRHAGGKGQMIKSARALTHGVWPRGKKAIRSLTLRAVAVLDSDARFPGDTVNMRIQSRLRPFVAFVHVLQGRTIENYAPKYYVTQKLGGQLNSCEAYFRMGEVQRNHYPLKSGFVRGNIVQPHAGFLVDPDWQREERALYQTVPPADWALIARGFGDALAAIYVESKYRCAPNERRILTVAQANELDDLLSKIVEHL
ncbi:hypothetical protein [Reyranella sp.]|uniref:hypothetical protein n=1 Tax=Reyranella sp. TaxID=1929291 RepID=UPI003D0FDA6D